MTLGRKLKALFLYTLGRSGLKADRQAVLAAANAMKFPVSEENILCGRCLIVILVEF